MTEQEMTEMEICAWKTDKQISEKEEPEQLDWPPVRKTWGLFTDSAGLFDCTFFFFQT